MDAFASPAPTFFRPFPESFLSGRGGGENGFPLHPMLSEFAKTRSGFLTKGEKFTPSFSPPPWMIFGMLWRGDLKKINHAFAEKFFGVRAYTLRCNRALLLVQPNLENRQETFAHQGANVVVLSRYPSCFFAPVPHPTQKTHFKGRTVANSTPTPRGNTPPPKKLT